MISKLLGASEVNLTTSAAAVTAPSTLDWKCSSVVAGAVDSGSFVSWQRQEASDSSVAATCLDSKESIELTANPGQTVFYAKMASGTATLQLEWWG